MNKLYFLLLLAIIATSCVPLYRPSAALTPTFEGEGDVEAQASFNREGIDGSLGYSVTDNFGVFVGGTYDNIDRRPDTAYGSSRITRYLYGAIGVYGEISSYPELYLGAYLGYGSGYLRVRGETYPSIPKREDDEKIRIQQRGWFDKYFFQVNLSKVEESRGNSLPIWSFFTIRFENISFYKFEFLGDSYKQMGTHRNTSFVEFMYGQQYALFNNNFKAFYQVGLTFKTSKEKIQYEYRPLRLNLGLSYNLPLKAK